MQTYVPFDARAPKSRLAEALSPAERGTLARTMLADVLAGLAALDREPTVLATDAVDVDASVRVDDRPLTPAVNDVLAEADGPVAVVMADLPLATPAALERLYAPDADVVLAPGRGGGTNALVARGPAFRVDYHGASIRDHRAAAQAVDATVAEVDSARLATDVDAPADLVEVLLHGRGEAADYLREIGFSVALTGDRVTAARDNEST
jgi:2-phospho-L-lactate guanylyltransferase